MLSCSVIRYATYAMPPRIMPYHIIKPGIDTRVVCFASTATRRVYDPPNGVEY